MSNYTSQNAQSVYFGTQIIWFIFGAIEILLTLRFILKLFGAEAAALFTSTIYTITDVLVGPFTTVFSVTYAGGSVFEWTTILAAVVYFVIAAGIVNLLLMGEGVTTTEASTRLRDLK
jgi:hypothetical protein